MVFSNLFFIYLFLPLNLILYFISSNKTWRNGVLLAFSFFFYAWGEPVGKVHRIFSPERAEPPDEAGAGSLAAV